VFCVLFYLNKLDSFFIRTHSHVLFFSCLLLVSSGIPLLANASVNCLKESLAGTESAGDGGYKAVGPQTKYGRPLGKYQFIPSNISKYTNLSPSQFLGNPSAQEAAMDQLLSDNWSYAKSRGWDKYVGTKKFTYTFRGRSKTTTLTKEGLLASMHLGGPNSTGKFLRGTGNPADNLGTSVGAYAGHHGTNCGGTSENAEEGLGQESEAKLADAMNWDDCFEWEQPSVQVVGMCGGTNPAPIISVDFKYTEPPLLIEANTESGKSAIMGVPGVSEAMAALSNGDRSSPNFSANMPGAGHIPRAFFEAHVWGVSPKGRFDSSGGEMDVKRSLACDLADEMSGCCFFVFAHLNN